MIKLIKQRDQTNDVNLCYSTKHLAWVIWLEALNLEKTLKPNFQLIKYWRIYKNEKKNHKKDWKITVISQKKDEVYSGQPTTEPTYYVMKSK